MSGYHHLNQNGGVMEFLLGLIILVWLYFGWKKGTSKHRSKGGQTKFGDWRDDDASDKQLEYLESLGGKVPARGLTKGEASERIARLEPIDESDAEVLRFFKVSTRGVTKDQAAEAVEVLLADEQHREAWGQRPPSIYLKEFFRFFGVRLPAGIGYDAAKNLKRDKLQELELVDSEKVSNWRSYERLLEELFDPELREGWDIKKPSITLVRECVEEMRAAGITYEEIADDVGELVELMIDKKPELEK